LHLDPPARRAETAMAAAKIAFLVIL